MKKILIGSFVLFSTISTAQMQYQWSRDFGNTSDDQARCVTTDGTNTVISAGYFSGNVNFDATGGSAFLDATGCGTSDMYIVQYNTNGAFMWAKQIGGIGSGVEIPESIIVDLTGNIYVTGRFTKNESGGGSSDFNVGGTAMPITCAGGDDIFVAKYNSSGVCQWVQRFGNTGEDQGWGIAFAPGGGILVCGSFQGSVDFDPAPGAKLNLISNAGSIDAFWIKLTVVGGTTWAKKVGSTTSDYAYDIIGDPVNSKFYVTGTFSNPADFDPNAGVVTINPTTPGNVDIFVAYYSITSSGYQWVNIFGSIDEDIATGVTCDGDKVFITGSLGYGTTTFPGGTGSHNNTGSGGDIFVAAFLNSGTGSWAFGLSGNQDDRGQDIDLDDNQYVYISGYMSSSSIDFDPGILGMALGTFGFSDAFVARYRGTGIFMTANHYGTISGSDDCPGIAVYTNSIDMVNDVYISGAFGGDATDQIDFNPGFASGSHVCNGANDIFLVKLKWTTPTRLVAAGTTFTVTPYPNPTSGNLFLNETTAGYVIEIFSSDGKICSSISILYDGQTAIDMSTYPDGIYMLIIRKPDGTSTTDRIIVQH